MSLFRRACVVAIRLVLAMTAIFGAVHVFRLGLLPAIQALFQPGEELTSVLRRTGIALSALGAYWAYVRLVEKRPANELRPAPVAIAAGAAGGALLISLASLSLLAIGAYQVVEWRGLQGGLAGTACLIVIAAMLEELVFRVVLFRILAEACGTLPALLLSSALFAAVHYENLDPGTSTLAIVTTMVAGTLIGAFWTLVFVLSRNLWVATANHAAWNFAIILSGAPLSGVEDWIGLAPFAIEVHGPAWLTGGAFGPEDSVFGIAVTVLGLFVVRRLLRAKAAAAAGVFPQAA